MISYHMSVDISQTVRQTLAPVSSAAKEHLKQFVCRAVKLTARSNCQSLHLSSSPSLTVLPATTGKSITSSSGVKSLLQTILTDARKQLIPRKSLAVPIDSQFASRYSDPNHPANSGSLIALVTGGKVDPRRRRRERRARRKGLDPSTVPVAPR
ncbi:hypothetical protein V1522DRAFT_431525 [Lipomyces starkeyi]